MEKIKTEVISLLKTFAFSLVFVFLFTSFIAQPIKVDGSSMYPTLKDKDVGFSQVFNKSNIDRFDIVIVEAETNKHFVKRIIGLPNETIKCVDGIIYIDDKPIVEDFLSDDYMNSQGGKDTFTSDFSEVKLGEDEIFIMGDNRPNSSDSRYYGAFKLGDITAKNILRIFPISEFGFK